MRRPCSPSASRDATAWLLAESRASWLPAVADALDGPHGVFAIAPAERWSSAAQSALMVREGPRRPATGSETGDWAHVDVYLAKTLDYRALLFTGSRWDAQALDWLGRRGATWVAVGGEASGARVTVRYPGDEDAEVALATETLVAELVAPALVGGAGDLTGRVAGRHRRRGRRPAARRG